MAKSYPVTNIGRQGTLKKLLKATLGPCHIAPEKEITNDTKGLIVSVPREGHRQSN
jgi:hypothetical protein